jgi:hypothetical protein
MTEMRHGTWWERVKGAPPAQTMEGRFTRLFSPEDAPPASFKLDDLELLSKAMTAPKEPTPTDELKDDAEENSGITSAYTYLGQFIDHDLTLDPTSHLRQFVDDVTKLVDFRTPRFDLDCLYGRGPTDQPYLYDPDGFRMLLGEPMSGNPQDPGACGVPRGPNGRALIGDPRNDENRIISQLQATMLRFHNRMAKVLGSKDFDTIRNEVRWHYQWIVINDFLPKIINEQTVQKVFPHLATGGTVHDHPPQFSIEKLEDGLGLMPVEFSVAAYRFGHSMVRPIYRLNETIQRRPIFSVSKDAGADLGGFRPVPSDWAIDWQFFINIEHAIDFPPEPNPRDPIRRKPQPAYKIDTSLVNPLAFLPEAVAKDPPSLGLRNLQRGRDFELPSGQTVARLLGLEVIPDAELVIGKATADAQADPKVPIAEIAAGFAGNAPLWAYILSEAQVTSLRGHDDITVAEERDKIPIRLGPVGGTIIAEVFASLLKADKTSFITANPNFFPRSEFLHEGKFGLAELINAALRQ